MKREIHSSDIELLMQLFVPKKYDLHIFDPNDLLVFDKDFEFCKGQDAVKVLVNLAPEVIACDGFSLEDFDYIFDFGKGRLKCDLEEKTFHYINNTNRTMRWLFPKSLKKASFLNFFNSNSIKAKALSMALKVGFQSPIRPYLKSGAFKLYYKGIIKLEEAIKQVTFDNYSIFTGTIGPNRKAIIELNSNGKTSHFAKIILNKQALHLLRNEVRSLYTLNTGEFEHLVVPQLIESNDVAVGLFSNIKPTKAKGGDKITSTHLKALKELYKQSSTRESITWTSFHEKLLNNISRLESGSRFESTEYIADCMKRIAGSINRTQLIPLATSHSDFTPWNTYVAEDKLYAYDWELSRKGMPMLYDLFHYVFQAGVLVKHKNYKEIQKDLIKALAHPLAQELVSQYQIDVKLHYQLYLLINISYYMNLYEQQEVLHKQAHWLVDVWKEALIGELPIAEAQTARFQFMNELVKAMKNKSYAMLKFQEGFLANVSTNSDLDLLVKKEQLESIIKLARQYPATHKIKVYQKSFMTTVELFFKDNSYLSLDLIHKFQRKFTTLLSAERMLKKAVESVGGTKVPNEKHDLQYTFLFYLLNGVSVPEKYQKYFMSFREEQIEGMINFIRREYKLKDKTLEELFQFTREKQALLVKKLNLKRKNRGVNKFINVINYIKDTVVELSKKRGFIITFSGVDGAGKSTTIDRITEQIAKQFRREVVVLRHRPSILPILSAYKYGKKGAEQRAVNSLPRTGNNKSIVGSVLRFTYYFIDYLIGQFYVFAKHTLRGKIVLYDRYYFDFINDAKRSNIVMPKWITAMLYSLILKPRLNVFLYASPEVILNRKKELDTESIQRLTRDYKALFSEYSKKFKQSRYIQIENVDLDETLATIMREFSNAA